MPYVISVSSEARVGVVLLSGYVTGQTVVEGARALHSRPEWAPGFGEVWDFLDAQEVDFSPEGMDLLVGYTFDSSDRIGANRVAIVIDRDVVGILLHLYRALTVDLDRAYESFVTLEAAALWLGIDADLLRSVHREARGDAA